jgi:lipoprotein-anchoring transpeptidase ErfK/SrfK
MQRKLIVRADIQTAEVWEGRTLLKTCKISTAKNGPGCGEGSLCTPTGKHRVAKKIGGGLEKGAILKSRQPTGEVWRGEARDEDLILTRILWLDGAEEHNRNSFGRYIYLHGTNQEDALGTPASHGCVRFSNNDIVEIYELLAEGAEVEIVYCDVPRPGKSLEPKP